MSFSKNDQKWKKFNHSLMKEAQRMNWGLYRCIRFDMARFLERENKLQNALETYLEVLYLDQNGPSNCDSISNDPELLKEYPPFDPKTALVAPGIVNRVRIVKKKSDIKLKKIKEIFFQHNKRVYKSLKLPIIPKKAWVRIEKEIRIIEENR